MAGKQVLDRKLAEVQALRSQPQSAEVLDALRRALKDRTNLIVAKAAAIVGENSYRELIPDLTAAFDRLLADAIKTDPQCWGKNALAKALKDFDYEDPALYIRGMRHVQLEPVYGGSQDTAVTLRGTCAHALTQCLSMNSMEVLGHLVDLLSDREPPARIEAARAMANLGAPEGALLLRLKLGCGDDRPEVLGHVMAALISLTPQPGIARVSSFLDHANEDMQYEAAAALGEARLTAAFEALRERYLRTRDPRFRTALLASMGASLLPEAIAYLLGLIRADDISTAADAIAALEPAKYREEVKQAVEAAVRHTGSDRLQRLVARW